MSLDHLLLWLSAKGHGSWSQFRGAVEELVTEEDNTAVGVDDDEERPGMGGSDLPIYQRSRFALQRLGHVEFFSRQIDQDWRVVPPALALLPGRPGTGVLCGARSPDLLDRLHDATNIDIVTTDATGMPQRIVISVSPEAVSSAAAQLGLLMQTDAPQAILSAVPCVRDPATWVSKAIPETPGWTIHRFSSTRLGWTESTGADAGSARTGLFRFVMGFQRFHYLRWRGRSYLVPVQVGKYAVIRKRRGLLAYDTASQTLSLPAVCRPPLLIERALILCSGLLPSFDPRTGRVAYSSVPPAAARLTAQLLRQELSR